MSILPVNVPRVALYDVARLFLPFGGDRDQRVELIIRVDDDQLNLRELSSYLALVDRVYGRLTIAGLRSYAQSRDDQLQIREIRKGSIEIIIEQAIATANDKTPIIITGLFLKYLPAIIKTASDSVKTFAEAHKIYQEGEEIRENRKFIESKSQAELAKSKAETINTIEDSRLTRGTRRQLRQKMKEDDLLKTLDDRRLRQLATLIEDIHSKEGKHLPAAERLAEQKVLSVELNVKDISESPN